MTFFKAGKSTLKMGIVGMPNVGKSSLFNLLCRQSVPAENFPFCTIEPNEARCAVPNERFEFLCQVWKPRGSVCASLQVMDIAGLIRGASEGVGYGNSFLSHIQAVDGIYHVIRAFEDSKVAHVEGNVDPVRDLDCIQDELCKKDLELVQKLSSKSKVMRSVDPNIRKTVSKAEEYLSKLVPLRRVSWSNDEVTCLMEHVPNLLTTKAAAYLLNLSKKDFITKSFDCQPINAWIERKGIDGPVIPVSVEFEKELFSYQNDPELLELLREECKELCQISDDTNFSNVSSLSTLPEIIQRGFYDTLQLVSFFTVGEKEVRSWTVPGGIAAPQAAGQIHSDFVKGFVKAQVVSFDDFYRYWKSQGEKVKFDSEGNPDLGPCRTEGKSYLVKDGDIIVFRVNNANAK